MNIEYSIFNDILVNKCKLKFLKNPIWISDVDIDRALISNKVSFGKKC